MSWRNSSVKRSSEMGVVARVEEGVRIFNFLKYEGC